MKMKKFLEFINESVIRVTDDIKISLYTILKKASDDEYKWILKIINNIGQDNNDNKNNLYMLSTSDKIDYFNITFFKDKDFNKKKKQEFKIGKALKFIAPDIPSHILGNIVAMLANVDTVFFKIFEGNELVEYYHNESLILQRSTLGSSCMNGKPETFFDIYSKNSESVKMIALLDSDNLLVARSLLWNTDKGWIYDRVYYSHEKYLYKLKEWAEKNDYKRINHENIYTINLNQSNFENYPYLDNFNYLCINKKILSNDDIFDNDDQVISLKGTEGNDYESIRNVKLSFQEIYDIYAYRYVSDLVSFINLAIDFDKWYEYFIKSEVEYFISDFDDILESYQYYILNNKDVKELFPNINNENYKEILNNLYEEYNSKLEYILTSILKDRNDFKEWKYHFNEVYGINDNIVYIDIKDEYFKKYFKNIIDNYCNEETFNRNFKKLYENDYNEYSKLVRLFF
jgi:hypothetical protein